MDDSVEPARFHYCWICHKSFKRREHMLRHVASHDGRRPYRCTFCQNTFQRSDVLKRHMQTCSATAGTSGSSSSGRRRACDRCASQKKACNAEQPCWNCRRKSKSCVYSTAGNTGNTSQHRDSLSQDRDSVQQQTIPKTVAVAMCDPLAGVNNENISHASVAEMSFDSFGLRTPDTNWFDYIEGSNLDWMDFFPLPTDSTPETRCTGVPDQMQTNLNFHFLKNFTSETGLLNSFECGTQIMREQVLSAFHKAEAESQPSGTAPSLPAPTNASSAITDSSEIPRSIANYAQDSLYYDILTVKTYQIVHRIKEVVSTRPRNSVITLAWSTSIEHLFFQFFAPANVRKFMALYWAVWHPNINFLHRPTFDAVEAEPTLIASIAMIGKIGPSNLKQSRKINC
jgi:hypothetical protein